MVVGHAYWYYSYTSAYFSKLCSHITRKSNMERKEKEEEKEIRQYDLTYTLA